VQTGTPKAITGVSVTPHGSKVYVTNQGDGSVSVIATATNSVITTIQNVGNGPSAFGIFIHPPLSGKS